MTAQLIFSWIYWNPERFAFTIPIINRPVAWYGIFFAFGFLLGFLIILPIFKRKLQQTKEIFDRDIESWPILISELRKAHNHDSHPLSKIYHELSSDSQKILIEMKLRQEPNQSLKEEILRAINKASSSHRSLFTRQNLETLFHKGIATTNSLCLYLTDRLLWFIIGGTIIGARLGHILFYDWPRYQNNPLDMLKVWEGGLASHGGAIGVMIALYLYQKFIYNRFPEFSFTDLLDIVCVPTAMTAVWIRIGNFFNQEIIGPQTNVPWAVMFGNPIDRSSIVPRHPTQLYEAAAYLIIFIVLYTLWRKKGNTLRPGVTFGLFMIMVFGSRFFIEFVKTEQSLLIDESFLNMGQYLSIPFIVLGLIFIFRHRLYRFYFKTRGFTKELP